MEVSWATTLLPQLAIFPIKPAAPFLLSPSWEEGGAPSNPQGAPFLPLHGHCSSSHLITEADLLCGPSPFQLVPTIPLRSRGDLPKALLILSRLAPSCSELNSRISTGDHPGPSVSSAFFEPTIWPWLCDIPFSPSHLREAKSCPSRPSTNSPSPASLRKPSLLF